MDKTDIFCYNQCTASMRRHDTVNDIVYVGKHSVTYRVPHHEHDSWELIYCTGGSGELQFADFSLPYSVGEIAIIPPFFPHTNLSSAGFTNIHINIVEATLSFHQPFVIVDDSNKSILSAFVGAFFQYYEKADQRQALLSAYGNLIATYILAYQSNSTLSDIVQKIETDITRNYADPAYALDEYLRTLPYSYDYLRKLFQKELGMTPHKYLTDKRLQTAANMLCSVYNVGNITQVAHLCGFRESLYFSRMFKKKYGVSPSYYYETQQKTNLPNPDADSMKIMLDPSDE